MSVSWNLLYVFFALCLFVPCTSCTKTASLAKPHSIKWHIIGDSLVLTWVYRKTAILPKGYYIHVQEAPWPQGVFGHVSYIHVKNPSAQSADLRGLKPNTRYYVKIVAYSEQHSRPSRTIKVSTRKLKFLEAKEFKASSVTDTTAVFTWSHESENIIRDLEFKIDCNGQLKYHDVDGKEVMESSKFEHVTSGGSYIIEEYKATTLTPNTLYTCSIITVAGDQESVPYTKIQFMTLVGKPLVPSPPKVIVTSPEKKLPQYSFEVELYATSDMYGSISHYIVYTIPVTRSDQSAATMPYNPIIPINKLPVKAISAHLASTVSDKLPFIVGTYESHKLPKKLVFDGSSMTLDFKPDTHYAFVLGAFTQTEDSSTIKYSLSSLSDPPVYIGPDMTQEWVNEKKPVIKRFTSTIILTLVVSIAIFSLVVFIFICLAYMKQKRYRSMTIFDEESDIEFNGKKNNRRMFFSMPKKPYHKLETDKSGEFHTRVDIVKKTSEQDNIESRPLYSVTTPPVSPRQTNHPTSPLIQSKREQIQLPKSGNTRSRSSSLGHMPSYSGSAVAANINIVDDRLSFGRPFVPRKPYVPCNVYAPSYYSQTHPPGTPRPLLGPPEPPPLPSAIRIGIREGYVMPEEGMPKRTLVKVLERNERLRQKQQQQIAEEENEQFEESLDGTPEGSFEEPLKVPIIMNSNSSSFIINEILSDDEYMDATSCSNHGEK